MNTKEKIRLTKYISSNCNYCSRRKAEDLIISGRVKISGTTVINPAETIIPPIVVSIDNKEIKSNKEIEMWAYNKPIGSVVSTNQECKKFPTIFELMPKNFKKKIAIGRLDANTSGLILLTNNGDFARMASHPSSKIIRLYEVSVYGRLGSFFLKEGSKKITIEGVRYSIKNISIIRSKKMKHVMLISLSEGKNREIRKIMNYFNLKIEYLSRISYGNIKLGNNMVNSIRKCQKNEINGLIQEAKNSDLKKFLYSFEKAL